MSITALNYLPPNLPVPTDDGACNHLLGFPIPNLSLAATNGELISLKNIKGYLVIYCYPMTGAPEIKLPDGWDAIPGARGCTPQACSFRDHYMELQQLNTEVFGMSIQAPVIQQKEKERIHLPFDLLSDEQLVFANALNLPLHFVNGMSLLKRVTLIFKDGILIKYFYPVFPPDKNIDDVLQYLKSHQEKYNQ